MNLMGVHRQIEKRAMKEQFRQTQAVLCAILKKVGPVVLNADDFAELKGVRASEVESGIEWKAV